MKFTRIMMTVILGLAAAAAIAAGLTQENVQALMRVADTAASQMDVDALGTMLSDDAVIEIAVPVNGEKQTMKMNKQQYLDGARQMMGMLNGYSYKNENEKITISGDTATVTSDVTETMIAGGQTVKQKSRQTTTVKLVDGKPLTVKVSVAPM